MVIMIASSFFSAMGLSSVFKSQVLEIALQDHHGGHFVDDFFTLLSADICGDELFLRHHRRQTFIQK